MRYWFDIEFIEDGLKIDLVSIGILAEDGSEYYAISNEFNEIKANHWVRENVLRHLTPPMMDNHWKDRATIAREVEAFLTRDKTSPEIWGDFASYDWVALCQLYGTQDQLPDLFPFCCLDVQQWHTMMGYPPLNLSPSTLEHHALAAARYTRKKWEELHRLSSFKYQKINFYKVKN